RGSVCLFAFAGSSTDIGPSVLGYLDTLANNFSEEAKQLVDASNNKQKPPPDGALFPLKGGGTHVIKHDPSAGTVLNGGEQSRSTDREAAIEAPQRTNVYRSGAASSSTDSSSGRVKKFPDKFLNLVSPNVQRMVSNNTVESSNGEPFARNHAQSASFNVPSRKPTRHPSAPLHVTHHKQQQLPLSKNITKLTHVNSELIDLFIDNITSGRQRHPRETAGLSPTPPSSTMATGTTGEMVDGNGNIASDKHYSPPVEELQNVSELQLKIQSLTVDLEKGSTDDGGTPNTDGVVLRNETNNGSINLEDAFVENCADTAAEHRNTVVEAYNYYPNVGRDVSGGSDDRSTTLADARAKLLDSNKNCKVSVPNSPKLATRVAMEHCTSTSTPSLDTTTSGSPYSSKASLLIPPNTPVLSSRPLSASSICSYSSSASSSGSEHHLPGGKGSAPGSYQASVESLADHSEPEQNVLRLCEGTSEHGPCLTVVTGLTMCERAVREIIDSESSYVKDLGQVIRGYLEDWKERACLKHDQLKVLFSNIQEIYDFNFKLLNRLREAKGDPVTISNCFIDLHAEFSCYTTYCTSYPEAISLLTTLLQATHTNALLVSTQKMLKHTLPLGSYLLKPVQRILKYHLLLDNLRKHYNDQQVALAHELMKKVAHNIDQVKTKLDQARLVKELAGILDGWLGPDLSVLGDLLHEGRLMEHSKPRIVLLFQTMLIIAKPKEDKRLQFRAYIPCKNLMLVEHLPGEPICFRVIPFDDPKGALQLTARNREEKRLWTQQIKQAMLQHYSDIPTRAKELVLQLGDEDERFTDKQYWKRPTNNSPIPEYLERRQQFRRSEMRMKSKKNLLKKDAPASPAPTFRSYSNDLESLSGVVPLDQHHHESSTEDCKCDAVKRQLQEEIKVRPAAPGTQHSPPPKPARSRSETRCGPADEEEERLLKSLYERRKLSVPTRRGAKVKENFASIRSYNSTMIPKRISDMRKRRPKTVTSSSTFYMDLEVSSEGTTGVTDQETNVKPPAGLNDDEPKVVLPTTNDRSKSAAPMHTRSISIDSECGEQRKDSEIISQLILDVEQFNKVLNKPVTKKKSFDASSCARPIGLLSSERKPEPPSTEPPCDEELAGEERVANGVDSTSLSSGLEESEPIYESLLRNVHVPYKYAPSCLARHSLPCGEVSNGTASGQKTKNAPVGGRTRPESDYVTLAYSELGLLKGIACEDAMSLHVAKTTSQHKTPQLLRNSDTNISYHRESSGQTKESDEEEKPSHALCFSPTPSLGPEESCTLKQSFLERQGSLSMKTTAHKSFLQRFISMHSTTSSTSMASSSVLGSEGNLLHTLQRKLSEPNGGGGSFGHIYKQGSIDLGSRIAHLDYADPKTLFFQPLPGSPTMATCSTTALSIASGTDRTNQNVLINRASMQSVNNNDQQQRDSVLASSSSSDSVCEEPRNTTTSTVYDDDEQCCFYERTVEECLEHDFRDSAVYSGDDNDRQRGGGTNGATSDQHLYEALTPVTSPSEEKRTSQQHQQTRNSGPPPPIPAKPAHLGQCKRQPVAATKTTATTTTNSRGWVLQQVRRFQ
uniref:DH domain-containing protein n=1 Tax=Anopheles minimus TaxID=112268 RepID=A0A182WIX1_9DIPT